MNFAAAEKIAKAILYEGYILYPYRPSAIKNRQRWNFGTLYPRMYAEAQRPEEPFRFVAECLVLPQQDARLEIKISFLQLRKPADADGDRGGKLTDSSLAWNEAAERSYALSGLALDAVLAGPVTHFITSAENVRARLTISATLLPAGVFRLHIELENVSEVASSAIRHEVLPQSLVSAHVLLGITSGEFVSLLDPQDHFSEAARNCTNTGVFPVLAGQEPDRSILLISPIILYDYPQVAPESAGDFFDGTEMDEMLTLRVLTLTDQEKAEMRTADPEARRILERTEALTSEQMLQVHGVIRTLRNPHLFSPDEEKER